MTCVTCHDNVTEHVTPRLQGGAALTLQLQSSSPTPAVRRPLCKEQAFQLWNTHIYVSQVGGDTISAPFKSAYGLMIADSAILSSITECATCTTHISFTTKQKVHLTYPAVRERTIAVLLRQSLQHLTCSTIGKHVFITVLRALFQSPRFQHLKLSVHALCL